MRDLVVSPAMGVSTVGGARCGVDARIAPPFMEATDASRLVCVVVVKVSRILTHILAMLAPRATFSARSRASRYGDTAQ